MMNPESHGLFPLSAIHDFIHIFVKTSHYSTVIHSSIVPEGDADSVSTFGGSI